MRTTPLTELSLDQMPVAKLAMVRRRTMNDKYCQMDFGTNILLHQKRYLDLDLSSLRIILKIGAQNFISKKCVPIIVCTWTWIWTWV